MQMRALKESSLRTTDLCDAYEDQVSVVEPMFQSFGGKPLFSGEISTIKCHEDNTPVRAAVQEEGRGRVLVVDGGGSRRCALLGDLLAAHAVKNGWAGVVVYGSIRDAAEMATMDLGVLALGTHPRRSVKREEGQRDIPVSFGGVTFVPGHFLYADEDGVIVSEKALKLEG